MNRAGAVLFAFVWVAACSGKGTEAPIPEAPPATSTGAADAGDSAAASATVPASAYCESIATAFCDFYLRCGRIVASTAEECRTVFLETCNERFEPRDVELEQAGLMSLSSSGIAACTAHLASVRCEEQPSDLDGPCGAMWVGRSPVGSPCSIDVESFVCEPGSACILGLDLCGTCEAAAPIGAPCGAGHRCAPDGACVSGTCVARSLPGQPCDASRLCIVSARCTSGVCTAPEIVGEGEACDAGHRCAYRSVCDASTAKCVRTSLLGEPCTSDRGCASGRCEAGACTKLRADGEACKTPGECRSGLCSTGRCAPLPSACLTAR